MKIAIYPGSFDPVTSGHLNIIRRAANIFDKLIVCVMVNAGKNPMFSLEERVELIKRVTADIPNVEVDCSSELLADYAQKRGSGQLPLILEELDTCLPTSPSAAQVVEAKELEIMINTFLHTLPAQDCNIFLRRYWYAESIDQISRRYDILPNTIKSSLYRTRKKLRAHLEKEDLL